MRRALFESNDFRHYTFNITITQHHIQAGGASFSNVYGFDDIIEKPPEAQSLSLQKFFLRLHGGVSHLPNCPTATRYNASFMNNFTNLTLVGFRGCQL